MDPLNGGEPAKALGEAEMDRTADLGAALGFVISRIEEQATRSGKPLTEEQLFLLSNLPHHSATPEFNTGDPEFPLYFVPRDTTYERLCALAKSAHRSDLELNPGSPDWEFAFNVTKLSRHPMCWLLQWAGMKQRRPWWDRWLLIIAALLFIMSTMPLMLLVINEPVAWWSWTAVVAGYISIMLLMYFASRRIEERQLERNIERCRSASRFASTLAR
jgi:hypothetical protein